MKKLIGLKKTKTAVFISGKGSNLENLIKFSKKKKSPISIDLIISNTHNAKGLKYSRKYNIQKEVISLKNNKLAEKKIFNFLLAKNIASDRIYRFSPRYHSIRSNNQRMCVS